LGGSESSAWLAGLGASFEAELARDEEVSANDLAFSLRQDGDLPSSLAGRGWALVSEGEALVPVDEVGADYVMAGSAIVPSATAVLRSRGHEPPLHAERSLAEVLGHACRRGADLDVRAQGSLVAGRLVKVSRDHLVLLAGGEEIVVGLGAVELIRLREPVVRRVGYSASRGLSG
jgi:hypothetical protein